MSVGITLEELLAWNDEAAIVWKNHLDINPALLDAACDIGYAAGVEEVSDNLQLQANGTLDTVALNQFQGNIQGALSAGLVKTPLVSAVTTVVSPTQNVATSGIIPITISVLPFGYVNAVSETINLSTGTT